VDGPAAPPPGYAPAPAAPPTVVVIQQPPAQPQPYVPAGPRYEVYSSELAKSGQVMVGLGLVGLAVGIVLLPYGLSYKARNTCHSPSGDLQFKCEYGRGTAMVNAGIVNLSLGGALTLAGAIMYRVGITHRRIEASTMIPDVNIGNREATLTWVF
jgi:hypothetical protein